MIRKLIITRENEENEDDVKGDTSHYVVLGPVDR